MARKHTSGEALLISTMLNTGVDPSVHGVTEGMLISYQPQYRWLVSYPGLYGALPTSAAFRHAFPDFPVDNAAEDPVYAAEVVRSEHRRREVVKTLTLASEHISSGDVEEAINLLQSAKFTADRRKAVPNALDEDEDFFVDYHEKPDAMPVPWKTLQRETGGIRRGDLWYAAARQGNGKSWILIALAAQALIEGRNIKFYSLEMPKHQIMVRMHVALGQHLNFNVNHIAMRDRVFDPVAYKKLVHQIKLEIAGKFFVQDSSFGKISPQVVAQDTDMDVVFIDYVGLMSSPTGQAAIEDWRNMAAISNALKTTALANDVRVIAAAQINREGDTLGLHTPRLKNLSQSDALGQDGDVVLTMKQAGQAMGYSIEKNRHGEGGKKFYTKFLPNIGEFTEITEEAAQMIADETT